MPILLPLLLATAVHAADTPEVALVGLHVRGVDATAARQALAPLVEALEEGDRVQVLDPEEVARRIDGRESLIVTQAFLGPAKALLDEGKVLYERADPGQAIPVLEDAVAAFNATMATTTDNRPLVEALLTLGFAYSVTGDEDHARRAFARVVQLDPGRELDEVNYAPKIVNFYADVRRQVLARGEGDLEVMTPLPNADVYVDGRRVGVTPMVVHDLPAGRHFLLVVGDGGHRSFGVVEVEAEQRGTVRLALEDRSLAEPERDDRGRARQTEQLYRALGEHIGADAILLGGIDETGELGLQLYTPHTRAFSKILHTDPGSSPYEAAADLAPAMAAYLNPNGELRSDRVSPQVLALDVSADDLLAELLLNPQPKWEVVQVGGKSRWYLWTAGGVLAAGGAAGLTLALVNQAEEAAHGGQIIVEIP
ncbi:MAG: PEGA domain-containing protein [Pseudomonadota bacterium]